MGDWVCFGFVFLGWVGRSIGVRLWGKRGCVVSRRAGIGFVLRKRGDL